MALEKDLFVVKNSNPDIKRMESLKIRWIELVMKNYTKKQKLPQFEHPEEVQ